MFEVRCNLIVRRLAVPCTCKSRRKWTAKSTEFDVEVSGRPQSWTHELRFSCATTSVPPSLFWTLCKWKIHAYISIQLEGIDEVPQRKERCSSWLIFLCRSMGKHAWFSHVPHVSLASEKLPCSSGNNLMYVCFFILFCVLLLYSSCSSPALLPFPALSHAACDYHIFNFLSTSH